MSESTTSRRPPELLAPAGSPEAFTAAVNNGADAIYLGLAEFNARRGAANFDVPSLAEATRFAHLRGARVYLTANVLLLEDELQTALSMVDDAWAAGVDAVIVQDLGFASVVRRELPDVRLHASTQLSAHNVATIAALVDLGVQRVTLARELSLDEIASLSARSPVELEAFVHGSLCYCYSGQCLMSSMIGRRSANRGLCAQPCRLPYRLVDEHGAEAEVPGRFLMSPRDLAGITVLPRLLETGVAALKIEGRMKSPEYVALVTAVYRAALDRAAADPEGFEVLDSEWDTLSEAFSRGFTTAYLTGERREAMMSYQRPNNRGVPLGRVAKAEGRDASISLDRALDAEDTIEVWTSRGRFAQRVGELRVKGQPVPVAPAGSLARVTFEKQAGSGDRVFRVANASLLRAARRTFEGRLADELRATPADVVVRLRIGEPLRIELRAHGLSALAEGPVVEPARTRPVTAEDVVEHVGRLGGTAYVVRAWEIELDAGAGIGFSSLHAVRREAVERLNGLRLDPWAERRQRRPRLAPSPAIRRPARDIELVAAVSDPDAVAVCLDAGASRVLLAVPAAEAPCGLPPSVEPLLPRIAHESEMSRLTAWAEAGSRLTTANIGLLAALVAKGACVDADAGANVVNARSARVLAGLGAAAIWASPELSGRQLAELASNSAVPVGAVVFGRLELMVAEHCALAAIGECGRTCASCARRRKAWSLVDDKGYRFPVNTDVDGRSHVYNSVPLDLTKAMSEVLASGVSAVRLDLQAEDASRADAVVRSFRAILDAHAAGRPLPLEPAAQPATSGHFFRGLT